MWRYIINTNEQDAIREELWDKADAFLLTLADLADASIITFSEY